MPATIRIDLIANGLPNHSKLLLWADYCNPANSGTE